MRAEGACELHREPATDAGGTVGGRIEVYGLHSTRLCTVGWIRWLTLWGFIDPIISASMGVAWCVTRVIYTVGYCRKDKENGKGRAFGSESSLLIELAMIAVSGMTGYQMLMG